MVETTNVNSGNVDIKWTRLMLKIMSVCAVIILFVEIEFFRGYVSRNELQQESLAYIFEYIILPTFMDILCLAIMWITINLKSISVSKKNWIISLTIFVMFATKAIIHYAIFPVIFLPIVAIVVTAIYAQSGLTVLITCMTVAVIIIGNIRIGISKAIPGLTGITLVKCTGVAIAICVAICIIIVIVNKHTMELLQYIAGSNVLNMSLTAETKKDSMTGLLNKGAFEESIEAKVVEYSSSKDTGFLAVFDIDHFKNVNDTYGHSNGDIVIKALCKMMTSKCEDHGVAFRYGGEEFAILFSNVELSKVVNIVEDIRTEFRCYYFQFMLKDGITCSCGIAEYKHGETSKAWFNRADAALYNAKESGRNRTVVSE